MVSRKKSNDIRQVAPFPGGDGIPLSEPPTATRPHTDLSAIADPAMRLMLRELASQSNSLKQIALSLSNIDRQTLTTVHRIDTLLARVPYVRVTPPAQHDEEPHS